MRRASTTSPTSSTLAEALPLGEVYRRLLGTSMAVLPTRDRLGFIRTVEHSLPLYLKVALTLHARGELGEGERLSCFRAVASQKNLIYDSQSAEIDLVRTAADCPELEDLSRE